MNQQIIDKLINEAGFSKTYEHDRLAKLITITVEYCKSMVDNEGKKVLNSLLNNKDND